MENKKYTVVKIGNVISRIAIETDIPGYTSGVIEPFFPTDEELEKWSDKQHDDWIKENNKRMTAICKFLNENDL